MKSFEYSGIYDTRRYLDSYSHMPVKTATDQGIKQARDNLKHKLSLIKRRRAYQEKKQTTEPEPLVRNVPRSVDTYK